MGPPALAFSWGYEGWGNHTPALVELVDAVEAARGYRPPRFVDVRLRRQVRAVGFRDRGFENLLGPDRTTWLPGLGNLSVSGEADVMTIKDPAEAATLLRLVEDAAAAGSRVIFFCACGSPHARATCHRGLVVELLLAAARRARTPLAVQEWPGGSPVVSELEVAPADLRRLQAMARAGTSGRLPLPPSVPLARAGALPHYSVLRVAAGADELLAVSGPAVMTARGWALPVHSVQVGGRARLLRQLDEDLDQDELLPLGARLSLPARWRDELLTRR